MCTFFYWFLARTSSKNNFTQILTGERKTKGCRVSSANSPFQVAANNLFINISHIFFFPPNFLLLGQKSLKLHLFLLYWCLWKVGNDCSEPPLVTWPQKPGPATALSIHPALQLHNPLWPRQYNSVQDFNLVQNSNSYQESILVQELNFETRLWTSELHWKYAIWEGRCSESFETFSCK